MNAVIIFFILGVVLLGLEVFAPGAILGILGGVAMLVGCIVAFQVLGAASGAIAVVTALALLGLTLYLEFVVLPKTALGRLFTVKSPVGNAPAGNEPATGALVGQTGVAETVLSPAGYVVINGVRHEVLSQSGLVARGATVQVLGSEGSRLVVISTNNKI